MPTGGLSLPAPPTASSRATAPHVFLRIAVVVGLSFLLKLNATGLRPTSLILYVQLDTDQIRYLASAAAAFLDNYTKKIGGIGVPFLVVLELGISVLFKDPFLPDAEKKACLTCFGWAAVRFPEVVLALQGRWHDTGLVEGILRAIGLEIPPPRPPHDGGKGSDKKAVSPVNVDRDNDKGEGSDDKEDPGQLKQAIIPSSHEKIPGATVENDARQTVIINNNVNQLHENSGQLRLAELAKEASELRGEVGFLREQLADMRCEQRQLLLECEKKQRQQLLECEKQLLRQEVQIAEMMGMLRIQHQDVVHMIEDLRRDGEELLAKLMKQEKPSTSSGTGGDDGTDGSVDGDEHEQFQKGCE